jgi:uncharacterized membrane protein YfcA
MKGDPMTEMQTPKEKRRIPFDQAIKITLLFSHFVGFSGWCGGSWGEGRRYRRWSLFFLKEFERLSTHGGIELGSTATVVAFLGSFIGSRLIKKMTMSVVKQIVEKMLLLLAIFFGIGWI